MSDAMTLMQWREAGGISQKEAAARLSAILGRTVHPPSVSQWESGGIMPGADVAEAIRAMTGDRVTGKSFGRKRCPRA